jgi:hypothetical protein
VSTFLKNVFGNTVANEVLDLPPAAMIQTQPLKRPSDEEFIAAAKNRPACITYDLIRQTIVSVRVSPTIGLGKWTKDDHLAEALFCLVKSFEPNTKLTYERIMQAIVFVQSNELMGAGKWSKEDHLAEYLYALVRLSETKGDVEGHETEAAEIKVAAMPKAKPQAVATSATLPLQ